MHDLSGIRMPPGLNYAILPWHLREPMRAYFEEHRLIIASEINRKDRNRFAGFLRALLEGDRAWALELADCTAAAGMARVDRFLRDAPTASWGSTFNVSVWLEIRPPRDLRAASRRFEMMIHDGVMQENARP